jgi:pyrroline-5-carboxylate reductase
MRLGIIGCGKMGRALLGGILDAGLVKASNVTVHDAYAPAAQAAADELGVSAADSNAAVIEASDTVLLCVKPQTFADMLGQIGDTSAEGRLLISIAAGVRIDTIDQLSGGRHRVVRVMPNTPAMVGKGASAFAVGPSATTADAETARSLLAAVGYVAQVEEQQIDAVTALSGSGPAYIFAMIESLIAGGIEQGLAPEVAHHLAAHTVAGAAEMVLRGEDSPSQLRKNVTSPNGTTFAALEHMRSADYDGIVRSAVKAARDRAVELGGED